MEEDLGRVTRLLIDYGELHVAQQTQENVDTREIEVWRLEIGYHLRRYGVHYVAYEHHAAGDGQSLVDKGDVVALGVMAWRDARGSHAQHIVAPLCHTHE